MTLSVTIDQDEGLRWFEFRNGEMISFFKNYFLKFNLK